MVVFDSFLTWYSKSVSCEIILMAKEGDHMMFVVIYTPFDGTTYTIFLTFLGDFTILPEGSSCWSVSFLWQEMNNSHLYVGIQ